ncbi:transcobalamin-2 [Aulostomus maculatus]
MHCLVIITGLLAFASGSPLCDILLDTDTVQELYLSLNRDLLQSLNRQEGAPNPSVYLAIRLSDFHNLAKETEHLNNLKTSLHNGIQSMLSTSESVTGLMALYTLALRSSCHDLNTVTFTVNEKSETLLTHLKRQMENEKEHISFSHRPLTNYYQYSLGVLALCVSSVRVNQHVSLKLIHAIDHQRFTQDNGGNTDTYAMAGMAIQCVKDSGSHLHEAAEVDRVLLKIRQKLHELRRIDGHIGNEFSTGLAVQALLAMGIPVSDCAAPMAAMREAAKNNIYHNPMALSQVLPALQKKSYLTVKSISCLAEDDTLVLDPLEPVVLTPSTNTLIVMVEVETSSGMAYIYELTIPKGSSLLETLELLKGRNFGFTFETESSLWGPFLSEVNGEQARQSDRRYWHLSSDGIALIEGIQDYKIQKTQRITIKNISY